MEIPSDFQLMGQMAITLAGFTGLIGASQSRDRRARTAREKMHIGLIVQTSAFVIVLGFLPGALFLLPIAVDKLWRISITVMAGAHLVTWVVLAIHTNYGRKFLKELHGAELVFGLSSIPFGISALLTEFAVAFGWVSGLTPFLYEIVLILFLIVGLWSFFSLMLKET